MDKDLTDKIGTLKEKHDLLTFILTYSWPSLGPPFL